MPLGIPTPTLSTPPVSTPEVSSITSNVPSSSDLTSKIPKPDVKVPKLPTIPTKIDVKSGVGVPGGFSGDNVKVPGKELSKIAEAKAANAAEMAKVDSAQSKLNNLSKYGDPNKLAPGASSKIADAKGKLTNQMSALDKKSADIKKSAVDFSNPASIPKSPTLPSVKVPKVDLPEIPSAPSLPTTTSNLSGLTPSLPPIG